jgi:membrane associated rhomboid family serine protease
MGIYDRDYIRQSPPAPGRYGRGGLSAIRMWSVNTWIIVACIAVYVIDGFLPMRLVEMSGPYLFDGVPGVPATAVVAEHAPRRVVVREVDVHGNTREKEIFGRAFLERPGGGQIGWVEVAPMHTLESFLHFSTKRGFMKVEFWRLIGFQFLHTHATLAHILFNMLGLYFFGPIAERYLGPKRYLAFYPVRFLPPGRPSCCFSSFPCNCARWRMPWWASPSSACSSAGATRAGRPGISAARSPGSTLSATRSTCTGSSTSWGGPIRPRTTTGAAGASADPPLTAARSIAFSKRSTRAASRASPTRRSACCAKHRKGSDGVTESRSHEVTKSRIDGAPMPAGDP